MAIHRKNRFFPDRNVRILVDVIGIVLVWRGIWALTDRYLFPDNPDFSAIISIIIGVIILYMENKNLNDLK